MLFTLAVVVFVAAIVVFFSQEIIGVFKSLFEIKGAKLILPLAIGSWIYCYLYYWCLLGITYYKEALDSVVSFLNYLVPEGTFYQLGVLVFVFTVIAVLPVFLLTWYLFKRSYKRYAYPYTTSTLLWLSCVFLLIGNI